MIRVLFVCTGNICRSPTAEGVFRGLVAARGLGDRLAADSAGTHGYHVGEAPDPRACAVSRARGYPIDDLRARRVVAADFSRFDHVVGMDRGHREALLRLAPADAPARISLLADHGALATMDVPDPYYGDDAGFEAAFDLIERGVVGLVTALAP